MSGIRAKAGAGTKAARRKALLRRPRADAKAQGRAGRAYEVLRETYADAHCALHHKNAWELLVATILSAQCTDARVNLVTPALFSAFPTPEAMAAAPVETLEEYVRSTGFFRNKAKNLKGAAERVARDFGGQVPSSMEDLMSLPGVARKTANVVRGTAYGLADGVVVDTHVARLSGRLGWSNGKNPGQIERDLMELFPKETWIDLAHVLILHGRQVCAARKPRCVECPVNRLCPSSTVLG